MGLLTPILPLILTPIFLYMRQPNRSLSQAFTKALTKALAKTLTKTLSCTVSRLLGVLF